MNNKLKAEFIYYYFNCDVFKQKDVELLKEVISGTRLNNDMKLAGYAQISFDELNDKAHRYPEIALNDEKTGEPIQYNRRNTNCLVYDLPETEYNPGLYDKLFLYHTTGKNAKGVWYGWLAYNSTAGKFSHKFFIEHETQDLAQSLNRFFVNMVKRQELDDRLKKLRAA